VAETGVLRGSAAARAGLLGLMVLIALCVAAGFGTSARAQEPEPEPSDLIRAEEYARSIVYQSPQDPPRYTSWLGAWTMPDGSLMIAFTQATGPLDRPSAPLDVLGVWGLTSYPFERDFSHLDLRAVYLRSTDGGATWELFRSEPYQSLGPHGYSGQAVIGLRDGTILRRVNGYDNRGYSMAPPTAYLQRLAPGATEWSEPQVLMDPAQYTYQLSRIQRLSDGRLLATGNYWEVPAGESYAQTPPAAQGWVLMVSSDEGLTWQRALTEPAAQEDRAPPNEWDTAELPNGDLLAMMRTYATYPDGRTNRSVQLRRQALLRTQGDGWAMEPPVPAPFEHSGHPELLATRQGVVLSIATHGPPGSAHAVHYTADAGATWKPLDFDPGRTYKSAYYPISLQTEDDTVYVFSHRGADDGYRAGLDQAVIMDTFRLRTYESAEVDVPPPTIDTAPPTGRPLRDVDYAFSGSANSFECSLDGGDHEPCASPHGLRGLEVGPHQFSVRAVGTDGRRSLPAEDSFAIRDTVDPMITAPPAGATTATGATFAFSGEESQFVTLRCEIDGQPVTPCAPGRPVTRTGLSPGRHTAVVEQRLGEAETKQDSRTWEIRSGLDPPDVHAGPAATTTHRATAYFTFSGLDGATFACWIDGKAISSALCSRGMGQTPSLVPGPHTFTVKQTLGQSTSPASAWTWTVADVAAAAPGFATAPAEETTSTTPQFTLSVPAGATTRCRLDGAGYAPCPGIRSFTGLKPGVHTLDADYKLAGVTSRTTRHTWRVNAGTASTVNAPTLLAVPPARSLAGPAATFRWQPLAGHSYACRLDDRPSAPCAGGAITYKGLTSEKHVFRVRATRGAATGEERVYSWRVQPAIKPAGLAVAPSPHSICAYPRAAGCDQGAPELHGSLSAPSGEPTLVTVTVACTASPCGPRTYSTEVVEIPAGQTAIGPLPLPAGYRPGAHRATASVNTGFGPLTAAAAGFTVMPGLFPTAP